MTDDVLHVVLMVGSLRMGGAERMMIHSANELSKRCKVTLLTLNMGDDLRKEIESAVRLVALHKKRSIHALPALLKFLKTEKPDALMSTQIHVNLMAMIAKILSGVKTKMVLIEPTSPGPHYSVLTSRASSINRILVRFLYPKADAIIAICNFVKEDLLKNRFVTPQQVHVIYNPTVNRHVTEGMKEDVSDPFFDHGVPVITGLGRLAPVKNFPLLIRAFEKLLKRQQARLLIIGDGPEKEKLSAMIQDLGLEGKVKLAGKILNPYPYLKKSDVFVLTSLFEGLPGALIEAMACGTQLVSVDCPGGSREILEDGRLGKIVPPGDAEALAIAMQEAISNPLPEELLKAGARQFESEKIAGEYYELIRKLVKT